MSAPTMHRFADADRAIGAFWSWWQDHATELTQAIDAGGAGPWAGALAEQVRAMGPRLQWDIRRGADARYALCLSGSGDALQRIVAERWRQAAPRGGAVWEFFAARPAAVAPMSVVVNIQGERVALADLRVTVSDDDGRERLNLVVFHPAFASLATAMRGALALLLLDHALGEDGVENWLGAVDTAVTPPTDAVDVMGLRQAVVEREASATGLHWGVVTTGGADGTLFRIVNFAVKRWHYPTFDARCDLVFHLERPTPAGIPDPWESDEFEAIEDGVERALAGHALLVARTSGRQIHRVHLYAREDGIAPDAIRAWAQRMARPVEVEWTFDPEWSVLTDSPT